MLFQQMQFVMISVLYKTELGMSILFMQKNLSIFLEISS